MPKLLFYTSFLAAMLAVSTLPVTAASGIYKSVDEDGNVVFSDEPSPGAEEIEKKEIPTVPSTVPEVDFSTDNTATNDEKGGVYSDIQIVNPAHDTAVRENAGNINVSVALQPALMNDHEMVLFMDGTEAARSRSPVFQFSNIERGTHTLTAAVFDSTGRELARSETVTFTLHRHSAQHPKANVPGSPQAPAPSGPTPTNPPSGGGNAPAPSGPTPTNPPSPSP